LAKGLPKSIIKKYGITKKAWAVFRGAKPLKAGGGKKDTIKLAKRRRYYKPATRVKHYARRARGMFSGLGRGLSIKSLAAGTVGLILTERYQPFGGIYKPAIDKMAIGLISPMIGMDNQDMLTVGVKEGLAKFVGGYLGGGAAAPTNGSAYL